MKSTPRKRTRGQTEIMMTPMIDVIFLLLIFFLTTSGVAQMELLMPTGMSNLSPKTGQSMDPPPPVTQDQLDQIVVKLSLENDVLQILMNGSAIPDDQLLARFKAVFAARPDVPLIIDPEGKVKAQDFVRVYDTARQAGLGRVYLAMRKQ
jgi:biopolymer transport protein ExbD